MKNKIYLRIEILDVKLEATEGFALFLLAMMAVGIGFSVFSIFNSIL